MDTKIITTTVTLNQSSQKEDTSKILQCKAPEQNGIWAFGIGPFLILEWDSTVPNPIEAFFTRNDWKSIFQNWVGHVYNGYYLQTQPEFKYSCSNGGQG